MRRLKKLPLSNRGEQPQPEPDGEPEIAPHRSTSHVAPPDTTNGTVVTGDLFAC